ncbi:hypothetical protein GCM10007053_29720 [Halioglobus pacificus]|uniref:Lipopolysaccharide biosynthesis protein, LPS:glycosyltransferase n=1 Tax=Parahalioglobus pacificus TaxID=930806 RepID=A0A918XND0_9GAMM|nr:hypothetical protein GCM10007053_29720 [Halioglobus pacificus]
MSVEITDVKVADSVLSDLVVSHHFKRENYFRLLIPELIDVERVLYLDSDIIVRGPLDDLFNIDLEGALVGACIDYGSDRPRQLGFPAHASYLNSGVMVMDLIGMRESNFSRTVIDQIRETPEKIEFVDQCGLNLVLKGEFKHIAPKYNFQSIFFDATFRRSLTCGDRKALETAMVDPTVIHFSGSVKPWHTSSRHPFRHDYWEIRNTTDYRAVLPDDFGLKALLGRYAPESFKRILRKLSGLFR